jgi:hypothetical protein
MEAARPMPDAREVNRVDALVTVVDPSAVDDFLNRCFPGSCWTARIRTAEVSAKVLSREPLGTFDERVCTCLRLRLSRAVPVEPGLRFQLLCEAPEVTATGVVRPWDTEREGNG